MHGYTLDAEYNGKMIVSKMRFHVPSYESFIVLQKETTTLGKAIAAIDNVQVEDDFLRRLKIGFTQFDAIARAYGKNPLECTLANYPQSDEVVFEALGLPTHVRSIIGLEHMLRRMIC